MRKSVKALFAAALITAGAVAVTSTASQAGNGAPSGAHYNLNIIGHDTCLGSDFTGSNRHVIAVLLHYNKEN